MINQQQKLYRIPFRVLIAIFAIFLSSQLFAQTTTLSEEEQQQLIEAYNQTTTLSEEEQQQLIEAYDYFRQDQTSSEEMMTQFFDSRRGFFDSRRGLFDSRRELNRFPNDNRNRRFAPQSRYLDNDCNDSRGFDSRQNDSRRRYNNFNSQNFRRNILPRTKTQPRRPNYRNNEYNRFTDITP